MILDLVIKVCEPVISRSAICDYVGRNHSRSDKVRNRLQRNAQLVRYVCKSPCIRVVPFIFQNFGNEIEIDPGE